MKAAVIAALMLFIAMAELPYGYYQILRFVICGISIYVAIEANERKNPTWVWTMVVMAILFNPLIPIRFKKEDWQVVDCIAGFIYLATIPMLRSKCTKLGNNP